MKPIAMDQLVMRLGRWASGRGPLYLLLAARIRQLIDDGVLPPETTLPPDRALAASLAVGRTTVVAAYDLLRQEGKIIRHQGSGTRVAPAVLPALRRAADGPVNPAFLNLLEPPDNVALLTCAAPGSPPPEVTEAYTQALANPLADDLGYHPAGHPVLRRALAARYTRRGVPTEPGQILVATGAQQAIALLTRLLAAPGAAILVEAPTYPGALELFREAAAVLRHVPVTGDGLDVDACVAALTEFRPALTYLIPTAQNPTGAVIPPLARRRLVAAAEELDVPLIEDEVPGELLFDDSAPLPLAAMASGDHVISVGSLSKVVWGGLRVGWIRAAEPLIARLARLKAIHDLGSAVLPQLAAATLVERLDSLRARRAATLRERHDHLCALLTARLPDWRFRPALGGQTLWVRLPRGDAGAFAQVALRNGVAILPGIALDPSGAGRHCLRVPFLAPPRELTEVISRLADAWADYSGSATPTGSLNAIVI